VVLEVVVGVGDHIREGDVVALLESMKMEIPVIAEATGRVAAVAVVIGTSVAMGELVITVERPIPATPEGLSGGVG
jgi:biotin carboxyl carrier protein